MAGNTSFKQVISISTFLFQWYVVLLFGIIAVADRKEKRHTMADMFTEKDLSNLDKQTLIQMLMDSHRSISSLQQQIEENNKALTLLTEEVANLRRQRFGRSSEKGLVSSDDYEQLSLALNEAEAAVASAKDISEPDMETITYKRRKKTAGKREADLKDLPATVENHDLTEEELLAAFPDGKWKKLPDEVYKRLEFQPATFRVIEHHVAVYAGYDNKTIVKAKRPADLLRNSIVTPSLGAGIFNYKYVNAMPIARLAKEFERHDVTISSQNMCSWAIQLSDRYLRKLYDRLHAKLFTYKVIHADETPVEVNRDGRPAGSKSYMWVYRSGELEEHPFALYDFHTGRKKAYAQEFLKDFHGTCVTDGYEVYHSIGRDRKNLIIAGCWSHARRRFADVVKALGEKNARNTTAYRALVQIGSMFDLEKTYADLSPGDRLEQRKSIIAPLVDAFFEYLKSERKKISPKSGTGKAISYCLDQEAYLRVFLTNGAVPMTNNAAERAIRSFCVGKHNWYVIDTIRGAETSAISYSIAETAKMNQLKPYEYFKYLLEEIPKHGEFEDPSYLDELLPWSEKLPEYIRKPTKSENASN